MLIVFLSCCSFPLSRPPGIAHTSPFSRTKHPKAQDVKGRSHGKCCPVPGGSCRLLRFILVFFCLPISRGKLSGKPEPGKPGQGVLLVQQRWDRGAAALGGDLLTLLLQTAALGVSPIHIPSTATVQGSDPTFIKINSFYASAAQEKAPILYLESSSFKAHIFCMFSA